MKYIADPTMHSMPAVTLAPNLKWLGCQSMDNKIVIYSALNRFKLNRKKTFKGHMVAGYACGLDFSPEMRYGFLQYLYIVDSCSSPLNCVYFLFFFSYVISGDADGKVFVWDWKTTRVLARWKAHQAVCSSVLWHPHETSKIASAGWDGLIKFWD
jgi:pre-mRNA-processing factor 17